MRKNLSLLFLLSASLFAQSFTLSNGWQLLGTTEDLNTSVFDNSCADFVWGYDTSNPSLPQWRVHIANGQSYTIPSNIGTLDVIKSGEGFWVKSSGECVVETSNNSTNFKFTNDWLNGKTLYDVYYESDINSWKASPFIFDLYTFSAYINLDAYTTGVGEQVHDVNYSVTSDGIISFQDLDEEDEIEYIKAIEEPTSDYVKICWWDSNENVDNCSK